MKNCFYYLYKEVYWEASWGEKYYKPIEESLELLSMFYNKKKAIERTKVKDIEGDFHALGHSEDGWKARIHMYVMSDDCDDIIAEKTYKEEDYDF